jgi:hypothetical protein
MRQRGGGALRYFAGRLFAMVSRIFPASPPRRVMQLPRKADIKSSCDVATRHERDDHRIDGYQSSS